MSASAGVALGYEPLAEDRRREGRIWIEAGGSHVVPAVGAAFKSALLAAVLELRPRKDARVVVLGAELDALPPRERAGLRTRVAYLSADGGLISNLNGWENISLPLAYHEPRRVRGLAPQVYAMLEQFGADTRALLAKLPEDMTAYERTLAGYVRMRLGRPQLVLAEDPGGGLGAGERRRAADFAAAYLADCPEGTFIQLEDAPDESG
jgi:predicted ABC-type transport system involved in lysophospholipase L1 biosynthesis ATPase subunit